MNTLKICAMVLILVRLTVPFQAVASEGFYAGASIGSANLDDNFDGFEIDDDTTAYRIVGGWFFWDGEAEINNASQASPEDSNPYLGLGLSYDFSEGFSINTDWSRYELESTESDVFSVGFQFRFGK